MRATLPTTVKRDHRAYFGLTMREVLLVAFVLAVAKRVLLRLPEGWPAGLRYGLAGGVLAVGLVLALGRWPLDTTGERLGVWAERVVRYIINRKRRVYV